MSADGSVAQSPGAPMPDRRGHDDTSSRLHPTDFGGTGSRLHLTELGDEPVIYDVPPPRADRIASVRVTTLNPGDEPTVALRPHERIVNVIPMNEPEGTFLDVYIVGDIAGGTDG